MPAVQASLVLVLADTISCSRRRRGRVDREARGGMKKRRSCSFDSRALDHAVTVHTVESSMHRESSILHRKAAW